MAEAGWRDRGWRGGLFFLIAIFVVVADQITKHWVRANIAVGDSLPEVVFVRIAHVQNTGSAFGLFTGQTVLLAIVAVIGIVVILMFYRYLSAYSMLGTVALGMVFGGAVGNQIDRISRGHVTDFILVRLWGDVYWPTFNVADSAITVGVIVLVCFIFWVLKKEDNRPAKSGSQVTPRH